MHPNVIWIVLLGNMLVFSTIDDQEVVYPCIFAFNFSSNVLVLLINMLQFLLQRRRLCWQEMLVLSLLLLLDLTICMHVTLEVLWVRQLPTAKGTNSLPSLVLVGCMSFGFFLAFPFVGFDHQFLVFFLFFTKMNSIKSSIQFTCVCVHFTKTN